MWVTEVLILAVQFAVVFGRLTVLTGKEDTDWRNRNSRELVCVSDDDGAGLTWNSNLNWKECSYEKSDRKGVTSFQNPNLKESRSRSRSLLDCELNQNGSCTTSWSTEGWSLTSSIETPMGPVLDRRWEGFKEECNNHNFYISKQSMQSFVVSIRGTASSHIIICQKHSELNEPCYWIEIGYAENTRSMIRKCRSREPRVFIPDIECMEGGDNITHMALSPFEWKTFVVTWNEWTRNISVYDSERMILSFVESERLPTRVIIMNSSIPQKSSGLTLFRLHNYKFLHTTDRDAVLASPELSVNTTNFCVEMAVGLCAQCQLKLTLANPSTKKVEDTLEVIKGSPTVHGLPAWRYVRVNKSISLGNSKVELRMFTILRQETPNPLWAVANVRSCPLTDSVRKGRLKEIQDYYESKYDWPNVTCQKLFYNENTVVNSLPPATLNMDSADSDCQLGKVGPYCSISCTEDLQLEADCKNAKICEEPGCTCSLGYTGPRCDERCAPPQYGHDCNQTCDSCLYDDCDFRTGECRSGCDQSRGYKVPPFCRIGIDHLPSPTIDFLNETAVRVSLLVKEEYKLVHPIYRFQILDIGEHNVGNFENVWMKSTDTQLIAYSNTFQPGVSYSIRCNLQTNDSTDIPGQWKNFTTRCNPSTSFDVEPKNTSLILNSVSQDSTSCPAKWYDVVFENRDTGERTHNGRLSSLPHKFEHLTPYTVYKIEITKGGKEYFSREVRTLEAAPPPVRDLEAYEYNTKTRNMYLRWKEPEPPHNGKILRYHVMDGSQKLGTVSSKDSCALWTEYICATIQISYRAYRKVQVLAENKDVSDYGEPNFVPDLQNRLPSEPKVFRLQALSQGLVDVTWSHPWRTGSPLRKFILNIRTISTNLRTTATTRYIPNREYLVENYQIDYKDRLYLMPSTTYDISIFAETVEGLLGDEKFDRVHTPPAIAFEKELTLEVRNESSIILLHIPVVLNDTQHSIMHVIVKGSQLCDHSIKASRVLADKAGIDYNDTVWRVATFPTNEFADKPFMVGDNKSYKGAINCPLKPLEIYVITVLVTEEESQNVKVLLAKSLSVHMGEVPKQSTVDWLRSIIVYWFCPIMLVLILAVAAFYLYQRKRMKRQTDEDTQEENALDPNRD